jgi:hypothetical protein
MTMTTSALERSILEPFVGRELLYLRDITVSSPVGAFVPAKLSSQAERYLYEC